MIAECRPSASIRSVERAFDLLAVLEKSRRPLRIADLSRATEMPKATVQRFLGVLESRGYVERTDGRYQVGIGVVPLGYSFLVGNNLAQAALPVLQELAAATALTATLYIRYGFDRIVVQRVAGLHPLRYTLPVGQRLPLLLGAVGRVLAAAMPPLELQQLIQQTGDVPLVSGGVMTREDILARLETVRQQGCDVSNSERLVGILAIAAPVIRPGMDTVAAIGVSGQSDLVSADRLPGLIAEVRRAAHAVAERCSQL